MKKYFILLCLGFAIACSDGDDHGNTQAAAPLTDSVLKERWKIIHSFKDSIREGDLVLRCGNDFVSGSLRDFSQHEKLYSHSGIALLYNGEMYVYNNMAGDINPDEIMRRDKIDSFITPVNNVAVGIYRYELTPDEVAKLKHIIQNHYTNKMQFDMNFDLATDDKMYCAELIAKSIEQATDKRITFSRSLINNELKEKYLKILLQKKIVPSAKVAEQREYLALDNVYRNPHCVEIGKVIFADPPTPIPFPTPENYQH